MPIIGALGGAFNYGRQFRANSLVTTGVYASSPLSIFNSDGTTYGTLANSGANDVCIVKYGGNGNVQWATRVAGTGNENAYGLFVDINENIYIGGDYASNPVTFFNADTSTFTSLSTISSSTDAYLVKYDPNGKGIWAARIGGAVTDTIFDLEADTNQNVYAVGRYSTNTTVFNADGTSFKNFSNIGTSENSFVVKYNANGSASWRASIACSNAGNSRANTVDVDGDANVYIAGAFNSTLSLYNSDDTLFGLLSTTGTTVDVYIAKYNTTGNVQWRARIGGGGTDRPAGSVVTKDGTLYISGRYASATLNIFDSNGSNARTLTNSGGFDAFLVKYNTNGISQWATRIAGILADQGFQVALDQDENIYMVGDYASNPITIFNASGSTFGTLSNQGQTDGFLVKYNSSGVAQWATRVTGVGVDTLQSVSVDCYNYVYAFGNFNSTITIYNANDAIYSTISLTTTRSDEIIVIKYSPTGFPQWFAQMGGTGSDTAATVFAV